MTEKEWQAQVVELAKLLGWRRPMHIYDSRRSEPGWPDLALVRDRLVMIELKTETGKLTPAQKDWVTRIINADVETYVVRPRHLDDLSAVLSTPRTGWTPDQSRAASRLFVDTMREL